MTAFVFASAVLVLLVLGVVLRPLWRGKSVAGIAVLLSLAAATGLLYTVIGTPRALNSPPCTRSSIPRTGDVKRSTKPVSLFANAARARLLP